MSLTAPRHASTSCSTTGCDVESLLQRGRASPTTRARPSTRCSTPASASRARSSRRSTAWPTPRSRGSTARRCTCPRPATPRRKAYVESGMLAAAQDYEIGGMQLPCVVEMAANSFFSKAGIGIGGGGMLTSGNANLLMAHGTAAAEGGVRAATSSPAASSARCACRSRRPARPCRTSPPAPTPDGDDFESDPLGPRYRLSGNKMWISAGEHELAENIVHLVLAKIPGAGRQAGARHARHLALHRAEEAGRRPTASSPASATTSRWPA